MIHLGFTGTRSGMSASQHANVQVIIQRISTTAGGQRWHAHHGDCIGADAEFHALCRQHALSFIVVHPGPEDDAVRQAGCVGDERRPNKPHMRRNADIVTDSTWMVAAPLEMEEQERGGTWGTVRMARKKARSLTICWRDGMVSHELR